MKYLVWEVDIKVEEMPKIGQASGPKYVLASGPIYIAANVDINDIKHNWVGIVDIEAEKNAEN